MIDFHSHILWNIDDGAKNFKTSLNMIKNSIDDGVSYICATPHFICQECEINKDEYFKKLDILRNVDELKSINILSGLEIYINPSLPYLYKNKRIWGINDGKYMLIELPMNDFPIYTMELIYELRILGLIPIIAHVERNLELFKNKDLLHSLLQEGAIFQMNSGSLRGDFGSNIKDFSTYLVKNNYIHILGSDGHNMLSRPTNIAYGYELINKLNPTLYENILFNENRIIQNKNIELLIINKNNSKSFSFFNIFKRKGD